MDPFVGPFMLGRDCTEIYQRDKGFMRAFMRMEDLPAIRQKVRSLANASVESSSNTQNQIDVVSTLSRLVPIQLTGEYFGFPGPDLASCSAGRAPVAPGQH
ncbi:MULTISPECIES: cytochrome P450 [unclassified Bradyrhizobium]|nr:MULTISPECIES: cytochrome P450 [unclassified Bradyrhizobium]